MKILDKLMVFGAKYMKKYSNFMIHSEEELEIFIKEDGITLVIFGHPTCSDCQRIFMRIMYLYFLSKKNGYTLKFCNIQEHNTLKDIYSIETTPTLIHFDMGKEIKRYMSLGLIYEALKKTKKSG